MQNSFSRLHNTFMILLTSKVTKFTCIACQECRVAQPSIYAIKHCSWSQRYQFTICIRNSRSNTSMLHQILKWFRRFLMIIVPSLRNREPDTLRRKDAERRKKRSKPWEIIWKKLKMRLKLWDWEDSRRKKLRGWDCRDFSLIRMRRRDKRKPRMKSVRDSDKRSFRKSARDLSKRNWKMMKLTDYWRKSLLKRRPEERLKKLDSSKKLSLKKSRLDFRSLPWKRREMQPELKRNKKRLKSRKDYVRLNSQKMKLREESGNKTRKMNVKDWDYWDLLSMRKQRDSERSKLLNKSLKDSSSRDRLSKKRICSDSKEDSSKKRSRGRDSRSKQKKKLNSCSRD